MAASQQERYVSWHFNLLCCVPENPEPGAAVNASSPAAGGGAERAGSSWGDLSGNWLKAPSSAPVCAWPGSELTCENGSILWVLMEAIRTDGVASRPLGQVSSWA